MAEPGRYFCAASMNLVTTIVGCRLNNYDYSDRMPVSGNQSSYTDIIENAENFYYINDGIYGSLSNIIFEKATYRVSCMRKHEKDPLQVEERQYSSAVFGPTCDSTDNLVKCINLPLLKIGDYLWFHNVGAYSSSIATNFNGFKTTKYFYIWKD